MIPDFNKKTIDTLAKRAAFKCSNPDCRVSTVGPNSDPEKSTLIGEAAHISGARTGSKRYISSLTDSSRANVTNAIWLCRNCHKLIDTDEIEYSSDILFAWREQHERYVKSELGNATDLIQIEEQNLQLEKFKKYPPLIRRIIIDKPDGWEWRLTAELMRYLNSPLLKKIEDLQNGSYVQPLQHVGSEDAMGWVSNRFADMSNLMTPLEILVDKLNDSWGVLGESGSIEDIHHICILIREHIKQIIQHEEQIYFTNLPDEYKNLSKLLRNLSNSQAEKLADIPNSLDEIVTLLEIGHDGTEETPLIIQKTISFALPKGWKKQVDNEIERVKDSKLCDFDERANEQEKGMGFFSTIVVWSIILWIIFMIF